MPKKMHEALKREARKKFGSTTSERANAYIYGTMAKYEAEQEKRKKKR